MNILTFDIGTSAVKTSLFSEDLTLLASAQVEYSLRTIGNRVEVDPDIYLQSITSGLFRLPKQALQHVGAIGLTSQGETIIPVDRMGRPVSRAIVWLDNRAGKQAQTVRQAIGLEHFRAHTGLPAIDGALPLCKVLWYQQTMPKLYESVRYFLLVEDYVIQWLTGQAVTEKSIQCSTGYFDLVKDTWWDEALALTGLDTSRFPALLEPGEVAGYLTLAASTALNLPARIPVCTGAMDQAAAALAAGCNSRGKMVETTGSALVAAAYIDDRARNQVQSLTVYRHAIPASFLALGIGNSGGLALKWLRDNWLCRDFSYEELAAIASQAPPGSGGLLFLPFLSGCVHPTNAPQVRASFVGATLATTQVHMVRAVFEGVAFLLDDLLHVIEQTGIVVQTVTSLGGGSKSQLWQQIKADICQRQFCTISAEEAASWGAAWLAAKAIGLPSAASIPDGHPAETWIPGKDAEAYQTAKRNYQRAFHTMLPLFREEGDQDD